MYSIKTFSRLSSTHEKKLKRAIMKASAFKLSGECATVAAKIIFPRMGNLENLTVLYFLPKVC